MRRWPLIVAILPSLALAGGPKYSYPTPRGLDDEMRNIYWNISNPTINTATISTATISNLKGVTDGSSACAGCIGQYVSSTIGSSSVGTNSTYTNVTSISLTAGDWDVTGLVQYYGNGATWTEADTVISLYSGNTTTDHTPGVNLFYATRTFGTNEYFGVSIPVYRISLSNTSTVYLKSYVAYSAGTPQYGGARLSARRVR